MKKLTVESALRIVATESDIRIYKLLDAHISELEQEVDKLLIFVNKYVEAVNRVDELIAENERLRGALEMIAEYPGFSYGRAVEIAREALLIG